MSNGYNYGQDEPIEECPYCSHPCEADFVDVGVGMIQCGPYHCTACGASEIGPHDRARELAAIEAQTGWYKPDSEPGSSANVINGQIVSHNVMRQVYVKTFTANPQYEEPGFVGRWWERIRERLTP